MTDFVVQSLQGADADEVAKVTGVSRWTLMKYRIRAIKNPGGKNLETLYKFFKSREGAALRRRAA
jgi:hypothetical protein